MHLHIIPYGVAGAIAIVILFCGDPHGDFKPIVRAVKTHSPQAVILLGDMDLERSLDEELSDIVDKTEVWFIPGNHDGDCDLWYDNLFKSRFSDRNLHNRVVEIDGRRVAGLGGIFREKIWRPPAKPRFRSRQDLLYACGKGERWRDNIPRKHHVSIFWQEYAHLWDQQADILVTHEAPSSHRYGFRELDDLAASMGVNKIFHGHHHERYTTTVCGGKIAVYGVGQSGVSNENGNVIIPGKQDALNPVKRMQDFRKCHNP